ncbi:MAG: hypothetical protein ABIK86_05210 [candidate division WOR-3 bacterium]
MTEEIAKHAACAVTNRDREGATGRLEPTFKRLVDFQYADLVWWSGKLVPACRTACAGDDSCAFKRDQYLGQVSG